MTVKRVVVRGQRGRKVGQMAGQKGFQDNETILYDTIMTNIGHYTFVQTRRMYHPESEG